MSTHPLARLVRDSRAPLGHDPAIDFEATGELLSAFPVTNLAAASVAVANRLIDAGRDAPLLPVRRAFMTMPLEHDEKLASQDRAVRRFIAIAAQAPELDGHAAVGRGGALRGVHSGNFDLIGDLPRRALASVVPYGHDRTYWMRWR